jgi:hypothetical protein
MVASHTPKFKQHLSCHPSKQLEIENIVTDAGDRIVDSIHKDRELTGADRICYISLFWRFILN